MPLFFISKPASEPQASQKTNRKTGNGGKVRTHSSGCEMLIVRLVIDRIHSLDGLEILGHERLHVLVGPSVGDLFEGLLGKGGRGRAIG